MKRSGDRPGSVVTTTDPADVFVQLYDRVSAMVFRSDALDAWFEDRAFWTTAESVTQACLKEGVLDPGWVSQVVVEGQMFELAVLAGIDDALVLVSPWSTASDQGALVRMWGRYLTTGRLNLETPGALLPRRSYPGRPMSGKEKHHYFRVVRVSPHLWSKSYANVVVTSDKDPFLAPGVPVRVAFVPVLASYDDLKIDMFEDRRGRLRYSISPRREVLDRLPAVLDALDRSGAQLGILPEGCLSEEIYQEWRRVLGTRRLGWRSKSQLRWLLLGSGPVGGQGNRAVLVDRGGHELLRQDKLADFTLTDYQVVTWGIPDPPEKATEKGATIFEDIRRDVMFSTLDGFLGRIAVLVCESLSRWPGGRHDEIIEPGPSHVLAPVFSKPVRPDGWEKAESDHLANLVGSWVMVANSLVTERKLRADGDKDPGFSCLVSGPWGSTRSRYDLTFMFGSSRDHLSVAEVKKRNVAPAKEHDGPGENERDVADVKPQSAAEDLAGSPLPFVRSALMSTEWFPELELKP